LTRTSSDRVATRSESLAALATGHCFGDEGVVRRRPHRTSPCHEGIASSLPAGAMPMATIRWPRFSLITSDPIDAQSVPRTDWISPEIGETQGERAIEATHLQCRQCGIRRRGRRRLVAVHRGGVDDSDGSMPDVFPVTKDGTLIGKVSSACFSPRLEKNIGYAMVPVEYSELGEQLVVERPDESVNAVVADRVFFKPDHAEDDPAAGSSSAA
jgi:glycine cleavage system T protein